MLPRKSMRVHSIILLSLLLLHLSYLYATPDLCEPAYQRIAHYRTQLALPVGETPPERVMLEAISDVLNWIEQHPTLRGNLPDDLGASTPLDLARDGVHVQSRSTAPIRSVPPAWALRFTHPDKGIGERPTIPGRLWQTDIGLTQKPDRVLVHISTLRLDPVNQPPDQNPPNPSVPGIAKTFLSKGAISTVDGSSSLPEREHTVPDRAIQLFRQNANIMLQHASDTARRLPVIYLSPDARTGEFLVPPLKLAQQLAGSALIFYSDNRHGVDDVLWGNSWQAFDPGAGGMVIFWPNGKPSSDGNGHVIPHTKLAQSDARSKSREELSRWIIRNTHLNQISPPPGEITSIDDIKVISEASPAKPLDLRPTILGKLSSAPSRAPGVRHEVPADMIERLRETRGVKPQTSEVSTAFREALGLRGVKSDLEAAGLLFLDVHKKKGLGYDLVAIDPKNGLIWYLEVKAREYDKDFITLERSEIQAAEQLRDRWLLAFVRVFSHDEYVEAHYWQNAPTGQPQVGEKRRDVAVQDYHIRSSHMTFPPVLRQAQEPAGDLEAIVGDRNAVRVRVEHFLGRNVLYPELVAYMGALALKKAGAQMGGPEISLPNAPGAQDRSIVTNLLLNGGFSWKEVQKLISANLSF